MQATLDQTDLKPPRSGRWSLPMVLALVAHLLLVAALTWGVNWQQDTQPAAFEAELWSSVVQQAAPREVKPPPPPPEPKVEPKVEPKPKPTPPKPEPKAEPEPPDTREADIAIEKAKKKKEEEAKKREADKKEAEKKEAAKKKAEEQARAEDAAKKKKAEEAKRKEDQKQLDEKINQLAKEKARKLEEQRSEAAAKAARDENLKRMMGQAEATGGENAKGTAQRASGPSNSYGGRVNAAVRPNVLLTEDIPGNPKAEIEVRSAPDGTIISRRLARSSGNAAWDKAALDAIDRTGKMPRDVDGRVPSPLIIEMRPRD